MIPRLSVNTVSLILDVGDLILLGLKQKIAVECEGEHGTKDGIREEQDLSVLRKSNH